MLFRSLGTATPQVEVHTALAQLAKRHPMLRVRFFKRKDGSMAQKLFKHPERSFAWELRSQQSPDECKATAENLAKGLGKPGSPVFGVTMFGAKESVCRVALMAHCAAVDVSSWEIILGEFEQILACGSLPPAVENTTYFDWVQKIGRASCRERVF